MEIFEFELRYKSYEWVSTRFNLGWDQEKLLSLVRKEKWWNLDKALTETSVEELHEKTEETYTDFKKRMIQDSDQIIKETWKSVWEYIERLEYELKVTHEMWYNTYFLIVEDYISRAKDHEIVVGPWRWSCAGSLMSYAIWVTDIDPLQYDLIFERFLNPARISMPDIDTDFEDTQRDKVIHYISDKYGSNKVAHIGTYMKLAAKASFKDVARVMWVKFTDANNIASMISEKTIQESIDENKDLQKAISSDTRLQKIMDYAQALEWTVRQTWVHACGMIIAPEDTYNYSVIQHPPKSSSSRDETRVVSQYEGWTIEDIGLLKMDLLWLRNLSIIKNTIKILKAKANQEGKALDPLFTEFLDTMLFHPPLDDEFVYKKIFWKGDTSGVFQFESDGMKTWLKKLKPTEFDDLIAMVSLYRPGPMEFIPNYIDRKHGIEEVKYMQLDLQSILRRQYSKEVAEEERIKMEEDLGPLMNMTYGIAVYQEQLMRLSQSIAWFSMAEADKLRKWVGKKIAELIEKIKKEFVSKAVDHRNYKPETATWIYEKMIEPAARYSFNKSHAACYAYISYQTAYLKAHYPTEFHAALLRSVEENTDKLAQFIDEIKLQGYTIQLPWINKAFKHVAAVDDEIVLGFLSIKWVGSEVASTIESERKNWWVFKDLADFLKRTKEVISKKSLESLIVSGALDEFDERWTLIANTEQMLDRTKTLASGGQAAWLFAATTVEWSDLSLKKATPLKGLETLKIERQAFKTFVSWHPLDGLYPYIRAKYWFASMFKDKEWYGDFTMLGFVKSIAKNRRWDGYYVKVEDISWEVEFFIKDKLDFTPFMIMSISGYMWRRVRVDTISVFDSEELQEKAKSSNKYDEIMTVSKVRANRFASNSVEPGKWAFQETKKEKGIKWENDKEKKKEVAVEVLEEIKLEKEKINEEAGQLLDIDINDIPRSFKESTNPGVKMRIKGIIKTNAGEHVISIWQESYQVNEKAMKKIYELLA